MTKDQTELLRLLQRGLNSNRHDIHAWEKTLEDGLFPADKVADALELLLAQVTKRPGS